MVRHEGTGATRMRRAFARNPFFVLSVPLR